MPRNVAQYLKLYVADVSSSELTGILAPEIVDRIAHSTRMPGGFWRLEVGVASSEAEYWQWREERLLARVLLEESGGKSIWEGRLEEVELVSAAAGLWATRLGFVGYWSNFADSFQTPNYSTTGDVIVKDLRDNIHADSLQLSTADDDIEAPGVTITQDYSEVDWSAWKILTDGRRGVMTFGDSSDRKMDLAVWDGRKVHYKSRNPSAVDWTAYVHEEYGGGISRLPLSVSWRNLANAVIVAYTSGGSLTRTAAATDAASIARWVRKEKHVPDIGASDAGTANSRRDTELALRKDPQQQVDGIALSKVWDVDGVEWPLCRVRAGDVLRVPDFVPRTGDSGSVSLDAFRTFVIEETNCDHVAGVLTVRPDREGRSLVDALISAGAL